MEEQATEQQGQEKKKRDPKFKYYVGIAMRAYPSNHQKKIMKHNSDASRFIYNRANAISKRNYEIKQLLESKVTIRPIYILPRLNKNAKTTRSG